MLSSTLARGWADALTKGLSSRRMDIIWSWKMELKEFGKYLKYKSFQQALHQARQKSYERIVAAERSVAYSSKRRKTGAKPGAR